MNINYLNNYISLKKPHKEHYKHKTILNILAIQIYGYY
ncbi:hypothetical protein ATK78_4053 [Pedobacter metabolipauper]|uniref:Uncharacterized protein n=1 Tax=Pedobacter metabolipauper TaxID=425513 RepID=A0A4R6SRQ4_9SPHI|nr:hypothetical protein ATK78_4053 [Pedobacter metabolipauper]